MASRDSANPRGCRYAAEQQRKQLILSDHTVEKKGCSLRPFFLFAGSEGESPYSRYITHYLHGQRKRKHGYVSASVEPKDTLGTADPNSSKQSCELLTPGYLFSYQVPPISGCERIEPGSSVNGSISWLVEWEFLCAGGDGGRGQGLEKG